MKDLRPPVYRGADHPRAKFTPEEVEMIRKSFDEEDASYRSAARRYGCAPNTVFRMVNRKSYRER